MQVKSLPAPRNSAEKLDAALRSHPRPMRSSVPPRSRHLELRVHAAHLDVRDSAVSRFAADAEAAIGPADILVNAAGTTAGSRCAAMTTVAKIDTNLTGAFRTRGNSCRE